MAGGYFDGDPREWFADYGDAIVAPGLDSAIRLEVIGPGEVPLEGAVVRLVPSDHAGPFDQSASAVTDSAGRVELDPIERDYVIDVVKSGFAPVRVGARQWPLGFEGARQTVKLTRSGLLRVLMKRSDGTEPWLCELDYVDPGTGSRCRWNWELKGGETGEFPVPRDVPVLVTVRRGAETALEARANAGDDVEVARRE